MMQQKVCLQCVCVPCAASVNRIAVALNILCMCSHWCQIQVGLLCHLAYGNNFFPICTSLVGSPWQHHHLVSSKLQLDSMYSEGTSILKQAVIW